MLTSCKRSIELGPGIQDSTHMYTVSGRQYELGGDGGPATEVDVGVEALDLQRGHEGELARHGLGASHDLVGGRRVGGGLAQGQLRLHPVQDGEEALHSFLELHRPVDADLLEIFELVGSGV